MIALNTTYRGPSQPAQLAKTNPIPIVEHLLSKKEASGVLGVCTKTLEGFVKTGRLPVVRFGGRVRIDPADLRRLIESLKS